MAAITKVSEITTAYLAQYLRIDEPTQDQLDELETFLGSAVAYVSSYVGLPAAGDSESGDETLETLDDHAEFVMTVCVLVQNQYDNRTFYTDKGKVEDVVNSTLGMHRRNLL